MVLNINGVKHEVDVDPDTKLLSVLRNDLNLTGSKYGCVKELVAHVRC